MPKARPVRRVLAVAPALLPAAAAVALLGTDAGPQVLVRRLRDPAAWLASGPDAALLDLLATSAWAALAWLALTVGLTALGAAPGRIGSLASASVRRVSPALLRRAAESMLCLGLVAGAVGGTAAAAAATSTAHAAPATEGDPSDRDLPPAGTDWPVASAAEPAPEPRPVPPREPGTGLLAPPPRDAGQPEVIVVRRGDSLWRLVESHLGPAASPAAVAATWPRWYEANRSVIGDDPDLLLPGQQLRPPV